MKKTKTNSVMRKEAKAKEALNHVLPFLVMAGIVPKVKRHQSKVLKELAPTLVHKTVLLPTRRVKTIRSFKQGRRYILLRKEKPVASISISPREKGKLLQYHLTKGSIIELMHDTIQWTKEMYSVDSDSTIIINSPFLQKKYLYLPQLRPQVLHEVTGGSLSPKLSLRKFLAMHNKVADFTLKQHKQYKRELAKALREKESKVPML